MSGTTRSALAATVLGAPVLAEIAGQPRSTPRAATCSSPRRSWSGGRCSPHSWSRPPLWRAPRHRAAGASFSWAAPCRSSFATLYGATALDGEPLEASFVVFMFGFVALLVGGLLWASRLRRSEGWRARRRGPARGRRPGRPRDPRRQRPVPRHLPRVLLRSLGRRRPWLRLAPEPPHPPGRAGQDVSPEPGRGRTDRQREGRHRDPEAMRRLRSGRTVRMRRSPRALTSPEDTAHMDGYTVRCPRCKETFVPLTASTSWWTSCWPTSSTSTGTLRRVNTLSRRSSSRILPADIQFASAPLWGRQFRASLVAAVAALWVLPAAAFELVGCLLYQGLEAGARKAGAHLTRARGELPRHPKITRSGRRAAVNRAGADPSTRSPAARRGRSRPEGQAGIGASSRRSGAAGRVRGRVETWAADEHPGSTGR